MLRARVRNLEIDINNVIGVISPVTLDIDDALYIK